MGILLDGEQHLSGPAARRSTFGMKKKHCSKLDTCYKILMVLDKDLAGDWQYAEAIRAVCAECQRRKGVEG